MKVKKVYRCPECGNTLEEEWMLETDAESIRKRNEKLKEGMLGEEYQELITRYPDGTVDYSEVPAVCRKCGTTETVYDLSFYAPDESGQYRKIKEYKHECPVCQGEMVTMTMDKFTPLCPECGQGMALESEDIYE